MTEPVNSSKTMLVSDAEPRIFDRILPKASTPVPDGPVSWTVATGLGCFVLAQVGAAFWFSAWASALSWEDPYVPSELVIAQIGLWIVLIGLPVIVSRTRGNGLVGDFGLYWRWSDVAVGLVAGVVGQLAVIPALYWPITRLVDGDPSEAAEELFANRSGVGDLLLLIFMVVVMAPLAEELFYRGLILRSLETKLTPALSIVVSAAIFALAHFQPLQAPGLFLFGLVAGYLAHRTGRLAAPWAFHLAFNATSVVLLTV